MTRATRTAKLSIYVQGSKGEVRLRRTLHDVSKDEAEQALAALRAKANRGEARPDLVAPTLRDFYMAYFDLITESIAPSTVEGYRNVIETYLLPRFGQTRLSEITVGVVNVWLREVKRRRREEGKRPLSGSTLNGYANILRLLVNYAVRFDVLDQSPFKRPLEREKVQVTNKRRDATYQRVRVSKEIARTDGDSRFSAKASIFRLARLVRCMRLPRRTARLTAARISVSVWANDPRHVCRAKAGCSRAPKDDMCSCRIPIVPPLSLGSVPPDRRHILNCGEAETAHLMEWLAVDFSALLQVVHREFGIDLRIPTALSHPSFAALGVTKRLAAIGAYLRSAGVRPGDAAYAALATHRSDVVRQWAAYVLAQSAGYDLDLRLDLTKHFAADRNMSVREVAWMTFRPSLAQELPRGLRLLEPLTGAADANIRRFAIEVMRPRSVWGAHLPALKADPQPGRRLLDNVRADEAKYVQDAAANWLNDASRTAPDWVLRTVSSWLGRSAARPTRRIVRRGLRTLLRSQSHDIAARRILGFHG